MATDVPESNHSPAPCDGGTRESIDPPATATSTSTAAVPPQSPATGPPPKGGSTLASEWRLDRDRVGKLACAVFLLAFAVLGHVVPGVVIGKFAAGVLAECRLNLAARDWPHVPGKIVSVQTENIQVGEVWIGTRPGLRSHGRPRTRSRVNYNYTVDGITNTGSWAPAFGSDSRFAAGQDTAVSFNPANVTQSRIVTGIQTVDAVALIGATALLVFMAFTFTGSLYSVIHHIRSMRSDPPLGEPDPAPLKPRFSFRIF